MDFGKMDGDGLREYLDFLFWQFKAVDAFWYIYVEEEQGSKTADHFNERVWERVSGLAARQIIKRFGIEKKGLEGFVEAQRYFPWAIISGYEVVQGTDEVIVSVPQCPSQMARLKRDLPEYECKEMHRGEFTSFAHAVDPSIVVECLHAPPDPHPAERFCRWRFTVPRT